MEWSQLLTTRRTGQPVDKIKQRRTEFQRDYDRMIFTPAFRRLQNKTQVFPLPGSVFVHNRLTHSIEVASLGRSLGNNIGNRLFEAKEAPNEALELGSIVSAACLAHDMGNPPFGHSGEKAISHYFQNNERGAELLHNSGLSEIEKQDMLNFDGNANTFRLLSHSFKGRREGGMALTYPTVASIIKYPRPSMGVKKFGYFQQDKEIFESIMNQLGIPHIEGSTDSYCRFPLVYLVEAADDICYQLMDVEDATRLGILSFEEAFELYKAFFDLEEDKKIIENIPNVFKQVLDKHERIAYLRSIAIGKLIDGCTEVFWNNREEILSGTFKVHSLVDCLHPTQANAMKTVATLAVERIYRHRSVMEVEISGFQIISTLLDRFIESLMTPERYYSGLLMPFIPEQSRPDPDASAYDKLLAAVDIVTGMTDLYAVDLYKKIQGDI